MTFLASSRLVAGREVGSRIRTKAFLGMGMALVVMALAATIVPNVIEGGKPVPVAVAGTPPADLATLTDADGKDYFDVVETDVSRDEMATLLEDGTVDAGLDFTDGAVTVVGWRDSSTRAVEAFSVAPAVELLDPTSEDPTTIYFVSLAFSLTFFFAASVFGAQIANSVVEEKSTRVVEILLSSTSPSALLTGKVVGNTVLAILQIGAAALAAVAGLAVFGDSIGLGDLGLPIVWFLVFFVFGFLMLAAMFAAAGSLISRAEDVGAVTTPVTMLVVIPYLLSFVANENETLATALSWFPFSSPLTMPTRVFTGEAAWWEPFGSLAVLLLTTVAAIAAGQRIYRNSVLLTGARVKLRDALA
ncbi:ABC transporter permease [soil metagenome]